MEFKHKSVLLEETIDNLNIKPDGIYVDGTLGGAGHSYQIAKRLTGGGRLIGIDQDADAIAAATERLKEFEERVTIVRNNYCNMDKVLDELGIDIDPKDKVANLSVSQMQMIEIAKAFSYNAKIVIMDEPTSSLTEKEVSHLFTIIRKLKDRGCGIVYISHKMEEIFQQKIILKKEIAIQNYINI